MSEKCSAAFLGLGAMGGGIAGRLLEAGWEIVAYDPDPERLAAITDRGAVPAESETRAIETCDIVLTSLPLSRTWVEVAETHLLPAAREGQVFVDFGTVVPAETRRLAGAFGARGAALVDAPVSGGAKGAASGTLYVFAGGEEEVVERLRPLLEVIGDPERITYCGPSGCGQVVKCVNQMAMGLVNAAMLESLAFGVRAGVPVERLGESLGGDGGWRALLEGCAGKISAGQGDGIGVKAGQYAYFLDEAEAKGFPLPVTRALEAFLRDAELRTVEANRPSPSFWHELMER